VKNLESVKKSIQTRGYWRIVFYPVSDKEIKYSRPDIHSAIQNSIVSLRGWEYPQYKKNRKDRHDTSNSSIGVCSWTDCGDLKEVWKFTTKGFFVQNICLSEDWKEPRKVPLEKQLGVLNAVYSYTEFIIYIRDIIRNLKINGNVGLKIELKNTKERKLVFLDKSRYLLDDYKSRDDEFAIVDKVLNSETVVLDFEELILDHLMELFEIFQWDRAPREIIKSDIQKFLRRES